uniref:Uncharacterized protein n=1 Tax=viral metagenome TaxID=1070528 RepID=A0A6C0H9L7_9ZZZZ
MSSITKIVNILSAKYGFDIKEATEHVKAEIQSYKKMTKEEKDAIKEAEKQAKVAAKEAAKQVKAAAKEAEKQAKAAAKQAQKQAKQAQNPAQQPEKNKYFVTFHNKSKQMDAEDISLIQEDYKLEFVFQVEKITDVEIVPLCASNLSDYAKFVKKHADDIDDNEYDSIWFSYQTPSQMNYTFLFHGEEYQVKFHIVEQAPRAKAPAKKVPKPVKEVQPVQQPEKNKYIVTFKNKSKKMNEEDIYFIEDNEDYKLEFIYQFQQTANIENIDDAAIVMYCDSGITEGGTYLDFVKKHPDVEFDFIVFCFEQPSQMNYTFVFNDEEYEVKFHKV